MPESEITLLNEKECVHDFSIYLKKCALLENIVNFSWNYFCSLTPQRTMEYH